MGIKLSGQHVNIVPLVLEDATALFTASDSADIWDYMPMRIESLADMEKIIRDALQRKEWELDDPFVIKAAHTNQIIGSTRYLDISKQHRHLEIGWTWLSSAVWRTAINTECKYLLLRHAFEDLGMIRVQFKADERNAKSCSAIERIGATYEGTLRHQRIMPDGFLRNSAYYSILAAEWPGVKQKLEAILQR